ncbi:acyl carrier protein [Sphingomonas sp. AR_OL41]|uniref:acyl carrier protein n=1 Tax=Sphingomonas sp. AR_OL41 TaxID=3042729 RepID=UPI00247FA398|nr:acyl carrier protein [Sphingomonas sp. AR_OL41]MDH7973717.1 acyl carrier protein [Sphingomonas sp. AR_OL41]
MTTEDRIRDLIAKELSCSPDQVKLDARFDEDLQADAIDIIGLTLALEDEFGVVITDDEMERMTTVRAAGLLVDQHLAAEAAPAA